MEIAIQINEKKDHRKKIPYDLWPVYRTFSQADLRWDL